MHKTSMKLVAPALAALLIGAGGCANYYKIHDPSTAKDYYTTEVRQDRGATKFRDGKTGSEVTIQNSEVKNVTREEYETGRVR